MSKKRSETLVTGVGGGITFCCGNCGETNNESEFDAAAGDDELETVAVCSKCGQRYHVTISARVEKEPGPKAQKGRRAPAVEAKCPRLVHLLKTMSPEAAARKIRGDAKLQREVKREAKKAYDRSYRGALLAHLPEGEAKRLGKNAYDAMLGDLKAGIGLRLG